MERTFLQRTHVIPQSTSFYLSSSSKSTSPIKTLTLRC
jgi:hypothetical protein